MLAAALALLPALPLTGQTTEGPLAPGGRLRIEVAPSFRSWDSRFGIRTEDGRVVEEEEPLGFELTGPTGVRLFPGLSVLQEGLREALAEPTTTVRLGSSRAQVVQDVVRIPIQLALGITDWLTLGVTVPLVQTRTELGFRFRADSAATNLGVVPSRVQVLDFIFDLAARRADVEARVAAVCPGDPDACAQATALLEDLHVYLSGLDVAFGASPFFPARGTEPAASLSGRLVGLNDRLSAQGMDTVAQPLPLADARLTADALDELLTDPFGDYRLRALQNRESLWQLGDVEVTAALRLLEGGALDSDGDPTGLLYQLGARALVRLGTGTADDPDDPFDVGSGDGQTDIEAGAFGNLRYRRAGLWADVAFGTQGERLLLRRVAPPDELLAPVSTRYVTTWSPGGYLRVEASPRFHLTGELALVGTWRYLSKEADGFELAEDPLPGTPAPYPSVLSEESEVTLHEAGLGLVYSTLTSWRAGRAGAPLELRLHLLDAVAGSGGQTPAATRIEASARLYWRLWGR